MAINTVGAAQVSLTVFGGLVTEQAAVDLPEGVSPDCQDVEFVPGSVYSRRALQKYFANPLGASTITYSKTFIMPNGDTRNLYLDSSGNLWWEDVSNNPGNLTLLTTVQAGTYAKSITAFGREYIAISDLLHGAEIPLQWDGTFLDRVTQDGPGAAPTVASLALPSVAMAGSGNTMTRVANVVTVQTATPHGLMVGYQALIAANQGASPPTIPPLAVGGGITQIVIDNESLPGIATITTAMAHGLIPQNQVIINGVTNVQVGGGITNASWTPGSIIIETSTPHGLSIGAQVSLAFTGGTPPNSNVNGVYAVSGIEDLYNFIVSLDPYITTNPITGTPGGTVTLNWPIAATGTPIYFEVVSAPTSTTFQVELEYSDAVWTTGAVYFPWEGTFFVASVPTTTSFTYEQFGPPGSTTTAGTVTPYGQVAPGLRQCQVLWLTRQGYISRPSPPINVQCNGGQYLQVTNIPIGPPNVVARILAFTGAGGAYFFYIPTPPQANAQVVATPTQINDNTTTSVVLDFSDNTLFSSLGISIPGNTPANQIVIDGALGFGYYADRLVTWGQRNRIQNLLNMGFEGGAFQSIPNDGLGGLPAGWTYSGPPASAVLALGHITGLGFAIPAASGATLSQPMYEDAYGAPIAQPNQQYLFRCWLMAIVGVSASVTAKISSASTGFSSVATVSVLPGSGQFQQAAFSNQMPTAIPSDLLITISSTAGAVLLDEMSITYAQNPYLDSILYGSYVDNPEAFDGVSGKFGSSQDTHKVMDIGAIRQTLYFLTRDPSGRLHQTSDNGTTEPSGWTVAQVASNCGLLSAFALTKSQADDTSSSGGEEWLAWASASGARIFGGDQPWKISQEIQPDWDSISTASPLFGAYVNAPAYLTCWALNDPDGRCLYFGLPVGVMGTQITNPNKIYVMSYRELETAYQIGTSGPIHTSFTGRLIATDHTRKWTRWNLPMNGAALMSIAAPPNPPAGVGTPSLSIVLFGGNGAPPGQFPGFGNVYFLNAAKFTDDDYGQIFPYYITYFFVAHDQEQQLSYQLPSGERAPLGAGRKLLQYLSAFVGAPAGQTNTQSVINLSFLCNSLTNTWPLAVQRMLLPNPIIDLECGGGSAQANRIAVKFSSAPANPKTSLDNGFNLQHLTLWLKGATHLPVRGAQ